MVCAEEVLDLEVFSSHGKCPGFLLVLLLFKVGYKDEYVEARGSLSYADGSSYKR